MQAKLSIVPIDQLSLFIGKKVTHPGHVAVPGFQSCWTVLPDS